MLVHSFCKHALILSFSCCLFLLLVEMNGVLELKLSRSVTLRRRATGLHFTALTHSTQHTHSSVTSLTHLNSSCLSMSRGAIAVLAAACFQPFPSRTAHLNYTPQFSNFQINTMLNKDPSVCVSVCASTSESMTSLWCAFCLLQYSIAAGFCCFFFLFFLHSSFSETKPNRV